jgi:hypothetical protein
MAEEYDFLFRYQRQRLNEGPAQRFIKVSLPCGNQLQQKTLCVVFF